ncbi:Phage lysozyme [compost metagenome]
MDSLPGLAAGLIPLVGTQPPSGGFFMDRGKSAAARRAPQNGPIETAGPVMARLSEKEAGGRNVLAFLDMLAVSEGTDDGRQPTKDDGYDVLVGGKLFTGYADHPNVLVRLSATLSSTAAGRYQILFRYWPHYRDLLELPDFGPQSQDRYAIQQIKERRAIADIQAGRFDEAVAKVRNIWASLPGAGYGQHEQKIERLRDAYVRAGGVLVGE